MKLKKFFQRLFCKELLDRVEKLEETVSEITAERDDLEDQLAAAELAYNILRAEYENYKKNPGNTRPTKVPHCKSCKSCKREEVAVGKVVFLLRTLGRKTDLRRRGTHLSEMVPASTVRNSRSPLGIHKQHISRRKQTLRGGIEIMKIASIQQICKGAKRIELFSPPAAVSPVQWISDGGAFYPLYNLPEMEEENVFALFDIPEKKQDKIRFEHKYKLPEAISFTDTADAENALEFGNISICARGRILRPLKTSLGVIYINEKYLKPFSDSENGVQLYERYTPGGEVYIAVKEGFLLTGIILPYDIVTKEFVEELKTIYELSAVAADNKKLHRLGAEEPEQIDLGDYLEE